MYSLLLLLLASSLWFGEPAAANRLAERWLSGWRNAATASAPRATELAPPPLCSNGTHTSYDGTCNALVDTMVTRVTVGRSPVSLINTGSVEVYDVACSATAPLVSCSSGLVDLWPNEPQAISVNLTAGADTGTATVTLTATGQTTNDVVVYKFRVPVKFPPPIAVTTSFNNAENQNPGLCASNCFAVTQAVSSVPYFSEGQPRNVTLAYNSDRAAPRPFVYADVTPPEGANAPDTLTLQLRTAAGSPVTFLNGETRLRFQGAGVPVRLGGAFDASGYATGVYRFQLVVGAKYSNRADSVTKDVDVLVVNERNSPVARGWTIAGLQRIHAQGDTLAVITDGAGSAQVFRRSCAGGCPAAFTAPVGEFTSLKDTVGGAKFIRSTFDGTRSFFNASGQLDSVRNRFGQAVRYEYDGSGRLTKVFDPFRLVTGTSNKVHTQLYYDATYGIDSIVGPGPGGARTGGRVSRVTVASDSTLRAFIDPDGDSTRFAYDASVRLTTVTDRAGNASNYHYFATSAKLDSVVSPQVPIDAGNGTTTNQSIVSRVRPWNVTGVPYVATSSVAAAALPIDSMTARITSPTGAVSSYSVDKWGQPMRAVDPLGRVTTFTRPNGLFATVVTNHWGGYAYFTYDAKGRLTAERPPGGETTYYRFDDTRFGQLDSTWGGGRAAVAHKLDSLGRDTAVIVANDNNRKTRHRYLDSHPWRVDSVIDPKGHLTAYFYDPEFGQANAVRREGPVTDSTLFDGFGRDTAQKSGSQPWRRVQYDVLNRPVAVYDGVNANPTTTTYGKIFRTRVQDPKGQIYQFKLNALGWVEREYDAALSAADTSVFIAYRYDKEGRISSRTNRRGETLAWTYDVLGRVLAKNGTNTTADSFAYADLTGGRSLVVGWNAVSRDSILTSANGLQDSVITRFSAGGSSQRFAVRYGYDAFRRPTSVTVATNSPIAFPARTLGYNWSTGVLDTVKVGTQAWVMTFDSEMNRVAVALGQSTHVRSDSFTTRHRIYRTEVVDPQLATQSWRGYGYDEHDRLTSYRRGTAMGATGNWFVFDGLGRLTEWQTTTAKAALCMPDPDVGYNCPFDTGSVTTYTYDAVGNDTLSGNATYATGNRLTSWNGTTFENDANGARTRRCTSVSCATRDIRYVWSNENLLAKVVAGTDTTYYDYNAFGVLVRKRKNGNQVKRHFLWEGGHLLAELDSAATGRVSEYAYYPGTDRPLALITGVDSSVALRVRSILQDEIGNVTAVVDVDSVYAQFAYDPWGVVTSSTGTASAVVRLGWKGLIFEGDSTQLYYVRNRWYDPVARRFVSEDPIGLQGGPNMFVFADADPINGFDPEGLSGDMVVDRGKMECEWVDDSGSNGQGSRRYQCTWQLPEVSVRAANIDPFLTGYNIERLFDAVLSQRVVDFSAGLGDALLWGAGPYLREHWNIGGVGLNSTAYRSGAAVSMVAGVHRLGYAAAAKVISKAAASGAAASAGRTSLKNIFRLYIAPNYRAVNLAKYPTDAALRAAAGRTNPIANVYGAGVAAAGHYGTMGGHHR